MQKNMAHLGGHWPLLGAKSVTEKVKYTCNYCHLKSEIIYFLDSWGWEYRAIVEGRRQSP